MKLRSKPELRNQWKRAKILYSKASSLLSSFARLLSSIIESRLQPTSLWSQDQANPLEKESQKPKFSIFVWFYVSLCQKKSLFFHYVVAHSGSVTTVGGGVACITHLYSTFGSYVAVQTTKGGPKGRIYSPTPRSSDQALESVTSQPWNHKEWSIEES